MDLKLIEQKQLVERYLLGRLSPPEAKFFEQVLRRTPQLAERIGLPDALKRTMQLLDETGTEWRERPPRFWHRPAVPLGLAAALLVAIVVAAVGWAQQRESARAYEALRAEAERGLLPAPTRTSTSKLLLARPGEPLPTYVIGSRAAPTLAELRFDLKYARGNLFKLTIRRDDGTWFARVDNLLRDSNGELRLGLNSAALPAGTYLLEFESVTLRGPGQGQSQPIGSLRLRTEVR